MAILGLFCKKEKEEEDEKQENIGNITAGKAKELIKTLSGGELKYSKKIIDNVVVFSTASGGAGASTILSNVAYLAAQENMRILVIDLDVMYPIHHLYFGNKEVVLEKPDLISFLIGRNTLGESIENNYDHVSLLCANNRTIMDSMNAESDIAITNFQSAINKVRQLFDLVLIDCPLKIEHTLCNTAFYMADSIYLVWDEGISSISNTEKIRRNMAATGIDAYTKMRVILNKRTNIHYNNYPFQKLNMELVSVLPFEQDIIFSSLRSEIFCEKGASKSSNANVFYAGMIELTKTILENGGYVK